MSSGLSKQPSERFAGMAHGVQNSLPQTERNTCCMLKEYCNALWPQLLLNLQPVVSCADPYYCSTWSKHTCTGICRCLGQPAISADFS